MQELEILYEAEHKNQTFYDRKVGIQAKKTLLKGVPKSGKTHLIYDYILAYKSHEYLYIDLHDERVNSDFIQTNLELFCKKNSIKLLIIENYDTSILLPSVDEIVLSTHDFSLHVKDFEELYLYPLDFEEFIAFDRKHSNIEHLFNIYANHGTFPSIVLGHESNLYKSMQDLLKLIIEDRQVFLLYKKFSELQSTKISLFQIYNQLKSSMKLSKDKLYASVSKLENEKLLFLVEKYDFPKANKKVFLIDFAFKNALSFKKDFLKRFENIVFLELMKKSYKLFYTDFIDLYLPEQNLAIICLPFSPQNIVEAKLQKNLTHFEELHVKTIEIISIGNEAEFALQNITCRIIPFWDWALRE